MKLAGVIALLIIMWIAASWGEMLLIGVLHDDWWALMPSMGIRTALIFTGIVIIAGIVRSALGELAKEVL